MSLDFWHNLIDDLLSKRFTAYKKKATQEVYLKNRCILVFLIKKMLV